MLDHPAKAHQAAPTPVVPAPETQPQPAHGPNLPEPGHGPAPTPEGPQSAPLRLLPLDIEEGEALVCVLHAPESFTRPWGTDRYPAGTEFALGIGQTPEEGDIALARLSIGKEMLGTIERGRFVLPRVGGQSVSFEIPEPAAVHVAPVLSSLVNARAWGALNAATE